MMVFLWLCVGLILFLIAREVLQFYTWLGDLRRAREKYSAEARRFGTAGPGAVR